MKSRKGFVSNSSSSSFIIAYKFSGDICKCCGRGGENPLEMIESLLLGCESEIESRGEEEVLTDVNNDWIDNEEIKEMEKKIKEKVKEGYEVAVVSVDYSDGNVNTYIEDSKDIIVLSCDDQ